MPGLGLQQRLSQRMALAPHMRQALAVLQAPAMELGQLLRREAETNPVVEILPPASVSSLDSARKDWERRNASPDGAGDDGSGFRESSSAPGSGFVSASSGPADAATTGAATAPDSDAPPEGGGADAGDGGGNEFAVLGELDDADYLYSAGGNNEYDRDAEEKRRFFLDSIPAVESLQQHLATQLEGCALTAADRGLAEETVGSLDDDGYLRTPLADIAQARLAPLADAERMLRLVQSFDPAGVGARDLRECLLLQLRADPPRTPGGRAALRLVSDPAAFALVAAPHRAARIAEALGIGESLAEAAVAALAELDPRPGRRFSSERTVFVNVEISVAKKDGRWTAFLDESGIPRVSLSPEWSARREALRGRDPKNGSAAERAARTEEKRWLDEKFRAAELLVQGLAQRQTTLLAVAQAIVDAQPGYFEKGPSGLRPMKMAEIAEKTGFNESTISRAVAGKWMRSPRGVTRLRDFFTSAVKTTSGGEMASSESAKDAIRRLVAAEDPAAPLSDQAIVAAMKERGIDIARRTVAKYRDQLRIPVAALRRRG